MTSGRPGLCLEWQSNKHGTDFREATLKVRQFSFPAREYWKFRISLPIPPSATLCLYNTFGILDFWHNGVFQFTTCLPFDIFDQREVWKRYVLLLFVFCYFRLAIRLFPRTCFYPASTMGVFYYSSFSLGELSQIILRSDSAITKLIFIFQSLPKITTLWKYLMIRKYRKLENETK